MNLRNIAIIAHVDHGKTTLVDALLRQSGTFRANQQVAECVLDSNDLERERGITILAKCTSILWKETRINIVDTPGHADFGGEVERILSMVDGVVLLVDAAEGPLPQTKFVLSKALALGLRPIVVINKVDRPDARAQDVLNEVFDLFVALDATEEQCDFPILYASGRQGWASHHINKKDKDLLPLFETVLGHVPSPEVEKDAPFSLLATILESDSYLGRLLTGRIQSGVVRPGMTLKALGHDGAALEQARITKVLAFRGLERVGVEDAHAGDIVALAGFSRASVADTLCDPAVQHPVPSQPVDPPTLTMTFSVNDSPVAGTEGGKVTGRMIHDRLMREAESNVAIRVKVSDDKDSFEVAGRGELQLGVLIETMRREGYELSVSRPRVIFKKDDATGARLEPVEEAQVDVDEQYSGVVVRKISERKGDLMEMRPSGAGKARLTFHVPSRGLIGYHGEFLTDTRGTGVMNRVFHGYAPYKGAVQGRRTGVMVSNGDGVASAYSIWKLQDRGPMLIAPNTRVYRGMIVGEHSKENDLDVNVLEGKKLTNIRTVNKDEAIRLIPPPRFTLEKAMAYIGDDELLEVTPENIRLRKRWLDPNERKKRARAAEAEEREFHIGPGLN